MPRPGPIAAQARISNIYATAAAISGAMVRGDIVQATPAELELAIARGATPTLEELAKDRALIRALNSGDARHAE